MKTVLCLVLVCLFSSVGVLAQTETDQPEEVTVEEITLARDDDGKAGETTDGFVTTDVPIHCIIQLNSTKSTAVKMNLVAVKANGHKAGESVVTVNYKTNGNQNRVRFQASPDGVWGAGKYRVDILLNGKLAKSLEFEVQKSSQLEKQNLPKFAPRRKGKSKTARKN